MSDWAMMRERWNGFARDIQVGISSLLPPPMLGSHGTNWTPTNFAHQKSLASSANADRDAGAEPVGARGGKGERKRGEGRLHNFITLTLPLVQGCLQTWTANPFEC